MAILRMWRQVRVFVLYAVYFFTFYIQHFICVCRHLHIGYILTGCITVCSICISIRVAKGTCCCIRVAYAERKRRMMIYHFIVHLADYAFVAQAKLIARRQLLVADVASKAFVVVDVMVGLHYEIIFAEFVFTFRTISTKQPEIVRFAISASISNEASAILI